MNQIKYIILLIIIVLQTNYLDANNIKSITSIIRNERIYPKQCRYFLPAIIPVLKGDKKTNEYKKVAQTLAICNFVKLRKDDKHIKIVPQKNTYDILQQNVNITYKLISLNIILGKWNIKVAGKKIENNKIFAYGKKYIINPTRVYQSVLGALPDNEKEKYKTRRVRWEIYWEGGQQIVNEYILD